jgi:hypothetical protein
MKRVAIESPLNGDFARNLRYARLCGLDCIRRGESPYASHLFFTQFLNDATPEEREAGIVAGFAWADTADFRAIYTDLGVSDGMRRALERAREIEQPCIGRTLPPELMALLDDAESVDALATEGASSG